MLLSGVVDELWSDPWARLEGATRTKLGKRLGDPALRVASPAPALHTCQWGICVPA